MPDQQPKEKRPMMLPKVYKDMEQLNRAKDFILEQLKKSWVDHQNRQAKWREWNKCYRLIDTQLPKDGCKVVDPEPQTIVDTLVSNVLEATLSQDPPFRFQAGEETDEDQAELMTQNVADSLRRIQFREKFERSLRQLLIYGTTIVKTPRKREFKKVKVKVPVPTQNGKTRMRAEEMEMPRWDDTDWENVSIYNLIPVGKGDTIEELDGVIELFERSFDDLKAQEAKTEDVDGERITKGIYYNLDSIIPIEGKKLRLVEYWGKIPMSVITGESSDVFKTFEGTIAAVIDFKNFEEELKRKDDEQKTGAQSHSMEMPESPNEAGIRLQENPFWSQDRPYLHSPYTPIDGEFYGIGVVEPILDKWHELNTTIRQLVDNKTIQLKMPTLEDTNANVQRDLDIRGVNFPRIKADDINAIKPYPVTDFSANGYRIIGALKEDMRRVSGATDTVQGAVAVKDQSATEAAQTFQQSGVRLKGKIKLIEERLLKPFFYRTFQQDMQFLEFDRIIRVLGKEGASFRRVTPDDIWGAFSDVVVHGSTQIENTVIKTNKLINFLSIAARAPEFANVPELMKQIWLSMGFPESDADKIVKTPSDETDAEIQQEIIAMSFGQLVMAKDNQDHSKHIQLKVAAFQEIISSGADTPQVETAFQQNIDAHFEMMQAQNAQSRIVGGQGGIPTTPVQGLPTPNPLPEGDSEIGSGTSGGAIL